jgi:hypothetical protein
VNEVWTEEELSGFRPFVDSAYGLGNMHLKILEGSKDKNILKYQKTIGQKTLG